MVDSLKMWWMFLSVLIKRKKLNIFQTELDLIASKNS